MNNTIDPLELQRLLDGRMSEDEQSAFLDGVDDVPRGWRTVALAFVEERMLRNGLQAFVTMPMPVPKPAAVAKHDRWTRRLTQFAVLTFALTMGVLVGKATTSEPAADMPAAPNDRPVARESDANKPGDYYVVITPGLPAGEIEPEPQPPRDAFDSMMTPVFDERLRELVRGQGYRVREEPLLYLIQDKKGDQYVIPQRSVSFVPDSPIQNSAQPGSVNP